MFLVKWVLPRYNAMDFRSLNLCGIFLDVTSVIVAIVFIPLCWTNTIYYYLVPETPIFHTTILPTYWEKLHVVRWAHAIFLTYYTTIVYQSIQTGSNMAMLCACKWLQFNAPIQSLHHVGLDDKSLKPLFIINTFLIISRVREFILKFWKTNWCSVYVCTYFWSLLKL